MIVKIGLGLVRALKLGVKEEEAKPEMESGKHHFVLVHGACHGAWSWYKVATFLKSKGHKVTAIDLAASGTNPKSVHSMSDYFHPLIDFMQNLHQDHRVLLVAHSSGGFSISVAMEMFFNKICVAVFVSAMMHSPDHSIIALTREFDRQAEPPMDNQFTFDNGHDKPPTSILFGPKFLSSKLYNLSPPEDVTLAELLVRPYRLYSDEAKLVNETTLTKANYGSVRRVYIVLKDDCTAKEKFQRWMIENNLPDEVKVISGSDHMVMCSNPQQLCSYLEEIADKYY